MDAIEMHRQQMPVHFDSIHFVLTAPPLGLIRTK